MGLWNPSGFIPLVSVSVLLGNDSIEWSIQTRPNVSSVRSPSGIRGLLLWQCQHAQRVRCYGNHIILSNFGEHSLYNHRWFSVPQGERVCYSSVNLLRVALIMMKYIQYNYCACWGTSFLVGMYKAYFLPYFRSKRLLRRSLSQRQTASGNMTLKLPANTTDATQLLGQQVIWRKLFSPNGR